jgi:hypothetical protein
MNIKSDYMVSINGKTHAKSQQVYVNEKAQVCLPQIS